MSKSKTNNNETGSQNIQAVVDKPAPKSKSSPDDYSNSSLIARAYSAGYFPSFTHQKLFQAVVKALNGNNEGNIDFNSLLVEVHMHRSSAMQIIKHMTAWNILSMSFNSSQVIDEQKKSWAFVKILHNPEARKEETTKSA